MKQNKTIVCLFLFYVVSFFNIIFCGCVFADFDEYLEELDFEKTLKIARPSTNADSVESDKYVIIGICDPDEELYLGGKAVKKSQNGIFSVEVSLTGDKNVFEFKQGDEEQIVTIYKNMPMSNVPKDLKKSDQNVFVVWPDTNQIITSESGNKKLILCCSAPGEAKVQAIFEGERFVLEPKDKSQEFTQFSFEMDIDEDKFESGYYNAGFVKYLINDGEDDERKEVISDGCIIFSDTDDLSTKFVEVSRVRASIFESKSIDSKVLTTIKRGCVLETDQTEDDEKWFKLKDFGYILKTSVCPAAPDSEINNVISDVSFGFDDDREQLKLAGTCKPNFARMYSQDKLTVRLYHTSELSIEKDVYQDSKIIESIDVDEQENHVDLVIRFKPDIKLSGYNIEYDEDETVIQLKRAKIVDEEDAEKESSKRVLKGVSVLLDAGHGGNDPGALGILGKVGGPSEKDFTLAYTLALKEKLESLGADVALTRKNAQNLSLDSVVLKAESEKPDFFISIHADSVNDTVNPLNVSGFTVFFGEKGDSARVAGAIVDGLSKQDELKSRGHKECGFYVVKNTFCPSVLIEMGMLTNPDDVEVLLSEEYLSNFVKAVSDALKNYFVK